LDPRIDGSYRSLPPMRVVLLALVAAVVLDGGPVSKVIKLLKDMQTQLKEESEKDQEVYEKLSCWCEVNGKGKDAAVSANQQKLAELESSMEALSAKQANLETSIKALEDENAENTAALATAAELRRKEQADFNAENKELLVSIDALKQAMVVLSRTQTSFLQSFQQLPPSLTQASGTIGKLLHDHDDMLAEILNPTDKQLVQDFVQSGGTAFEHAASGSEIIGILKQMKETFESNMSKMTAEEKKAQKGFEELKAAKSDEIAAGVDIVKDKQQVLAKTKDNLSEAKEDHEDTTAALTADQAFLLDLKQRCSVSDAEWEERQKTRAAEVSAVSEAIAIISDDDAHDTFKRTLSFTQVGNSHNAARGAAAKILLAQAGKDGSASLLAAASSVKLDGFTKVTEMLTKMIADLKQEQKDEVEHKDFCNSELHKNDMATQENSNLIADLRATIADLGAKIDTFTGELDALDASIADMHRQMQRANEDRQAENRNFQNVVADQRATQVILKKAMDRLAKFYSEALVQTKGKGADAHKGPPPPPGLSEYKPSGGAGGVMAMLESIIKDAANLEANAVKDENDATEAYVSLIHTTNDAVAAAMAAKVDKQEARAEASKAKVQKEADLDTAQDSAQTLANYAQQVHQSCDFVLQNFDLRQQRRSEEIEALQGAIAALHTA
jgi:chromosome segregation ATPase